MLRLARSLVSTVIAVAMLAAVTVPPDIEAPDDTISATEASVYDLPDGGTVVFNPTDTAGTGATVDVEPLDASGATAQTAQVAHRVLALDAGPVADRRAGQQQRAHLLGCQRRGHQQRPAALAVADDEGLVGIRMQFADLAQEAEPGATDLPRSRFAPAGKTCDLAR